MCAPLDVVLLAALGAVKVGVDTAVELAALRPAHLALAVVTAGGGAASSRGRQVDLLLLLAEQRFRRV